MKHKIKIFENYNIDKPKPSVGDRIVCLDMEGESRMFGVSGTVDKIGPSPEPNEYIIYVKWDNGSSLKLLSTVDEWEIVKPKKITEDSNSDREEISVGDRVVCLHMEDQPEMFGVKGTVTKIENDLEGENDDSLLISVKWDDGSSLTMVTDYDIYSKVEKENINEDEQWDFVISNEDVVKNFDYNLLIKYLNLIQKSGIVNMFGASPLLYCGSEHLERYYGENPPNEESFNEALEMSDEAKNEMIRGTVKSLESEKKDISIEKVNSEIRKLSQKIIELWITFYEG